MNNTNPPVEVFAGRRIATWILCFSLSKFSLPWNQTTLVGYAEELCFSIPVGFGYFFVNGVFSLLFISICQHHQAFYKMFKHSVVKSKPKRPNGTNQSDAKFFYDLIRFHTSVKELSIALKISRVILSMISIFFLHFCSWFLHTADVYSSFNAILLIPQEIMLAISLFYLEYVRKIHFSTQISLFI